MSNEPTLNEAQIALVKETWDKVVPIADTAASLFYERLFEKNPELAPMFKGIDMPEQRRKLVKAITMVVVSLDKLDSLIPVIHDLGKRHVGYGVREEHYGQVGNALLWTLETGLGDAWSEEAEVAWTNAYLILAGVMLEAAAGEEKTAA